MTQEGAPKILTTKEIALELVKSAIQSGVLNHSTLLVQGETPAKTAVSKAAVDAVYMVRLLQSTIDRLEQIPGK
ncbi:hypothetical protein [Bordetella petrii]|uniref:hypothetical protein n=1 Tax=Bordetella petrii TaxID=94624 RepID=UPI001E2AEE0D|nr:hypothetical protein [Bordetella petrii]MCD0501737.1 hypothetical protein [Bordetella petrii]